MMQITEDTPPDMLAGAMDLTVHLPSGKAVKMSVERSTPMMDLLVQITTAHHLQLSNHTLQVLGMAPSSEHSDKVLPFKPNTPIGTLDTQHIKVLPKGRTLPAPKYIAPGHQPFESTFRLKVHLPRNQLYVTRVSRNVLLEDIMKKVCEEKNLDPMKYEFKHPGNLDEVLDPKLTLSDYQITEIYVVHKGTTNLSQAFSATDIMVLRKEEERKQMHNKTGGGVFNLIFKRGKSSMGSGSVSSDNRSISPTHSDDSRSVSPPVVPAPPIVTPPKKDPPPDRPKPPQRKRRPAPKPPQPQAAEASKSEEKTPSVISNDVSPPEPAQKKASENGLTICHSRNSSDSSGYHEASILSDHCASTSLPRNRPKSAFVGDMAPIQSTSNLSKMSAHSRSTTSLVTGRKKKAAPPPPPVAVSPASSVVTHSEKPSPLVASQTETITHQEIPEVLETATPSTNITPIPKPRSRAPIPPVRPRPRSDIYSSTFAAKSNWSVDDSAISQAVNTDVYLQTPEQSISEDVYAATNSSRSSFNESVIERVEEKLGIREQSSNETFNRLVVEEIVNNTLIEDSKEEESNSNSLLGESISFSSFKTAKQDYNEDTSTSSVSNVNEESASHKVNYQHSLTLNEIETLNEVSITENNSHGNKAPSKTLEFQLDNDYHTTNTSHKNEYSMEEILSSLEAVKPFIMNTDTPALSSHVAHTPEHKTCTESTTDSPKITISKLQKSAVENIFTSQEFLKESKPPEVVGMIPKTPKGEKKNVFGKKLPFNVGSSLEEPLDTSVLDSTSVVTHDADKNKFEAYDRKDGAEDKQQHNEDNKIIQRGVSTASLCSSVGGIPGIYSDSLKKWSNSECLDNISVSSFGVRNRWVTGDATDTESLNSVQCPSESISPESSLETRNPVKLPEEKSLDSTDSGIAQDTNSDREKDADDDFGFHTPPPPPILDDVNVEDVSKKIAVAQSEEKQEEIVPIAPVETDSEVRPDIKEKESILLDKDTKVKQIETNAFGPTPKDEEALHKAKTDTASNKSASVKSNKPSPETDSELAEIDWHYQLPSPPKAFRDSSPSNLASGDSLSVVSDFKDSVVTSPELFEKLRSLEDNESDKDTIKSEVTSVVSEEPLNQLSLENLEKRKSLVYNRELATSLKMTDSIDTRIKAEANFASSVKGFETTYADREVKHASPPKPVRTSSSYNHTLPNFKITTYDVPKQNITVFEDDTIRSSTHSSVHPPLVKNKFGHSMENISFAKKNLADEYSGSTKEREYKFYKPNSSTTSGSNSVPRSGSFSKESRFPAKPVSRSKSTLILNKYHAGKIDETNMSRSNSLFDVSGGLQSLEVMKLIQNKLNTPTGSMENITLRDKQQPQQNVPQITPKVENKTDEPPIQPELNPVEIQSTPPKAASPEPVKKYYYRGPPAVNMSTWSERPKVPVAVKEDEDYKLGNNISSKLIVNTTNNQVTSNNSIEVRSGFNGTDQITQKSGNVVIKIGGATAHSVNYNKNVDSSHRLMGPVAYRKPFSNINQIDSNHMKPLAQRPHSIALPSDFDISRVPVVRSVELKKPYKEFGSNTSITHLNQETDNFRSFNSIYDRSEKYSEKFRSSENLKTEDVNKRVFRVKSFRPVETPVVRGFKTMSGSDENANRLPWRPSSMYGTLPSKGNQDREYSTNQNVPFSQVKLRRTGSSKVLENNIADPSPVSPEPPFSSLPSNFNQKNKRVSSFSSPPPPPAPEMPKITLRKVTPLETSSSNSTDSRDVLLESIRNFGGKKGLKSVKST